MHHAFVLNTFAFELSIALTFDLYTLEWATVKRKYANRNHIYDFLFDGNSNVRHICHHFRDIHRRNMRYIKLDVWND